MTVRIGRQWELERLALALVDSPRLAGSLAAAREVFRAEPNARTRDGSRSFDDAVRQHFLGAVQLATNNDPAHPDVLATCLYDHPLDDGAFPSALHGGLENPDNVYRVIPIGSEWSYRLTGVRHASAPAQVSYELMDSVPGVDGIGEQLGLLVDRDMQVEPDGSFTISIDSHPALGRPNHLQCPPNGRAIFVRDTLSDWTTQRPDRLQVEVVDGPARPPRTEDQTIADAIELTVGYARFWNQLRTGFLKTMNVPTNAFAAPVERTGGWGHIVNACFDLGEDEALVFTTDPNPAPYHAVLIGNHWWIALDASRRSGAYNMAQASANEDGTYSFVIAARDPGAGNWLDTGGLLSGMVQARWQGAEPGAAAPSDIRDVKVLPVSEVVGRLTPVSPEQRASQLADRTASYFTRLDYL